MKHVCANCGSAEIEPGEAGARSQCALCGHTKFNAERETRNADPDIVPSNNFPMVPTPAARRWFDQMHAAVDEA